MTTQAEHDRNAYARRHGVRPPLTEQARRAKQARNRKHLARRTPEQVARILADRFPDGRQTCKGCGQHLPLSAFVPRPTRHVPISGYCQPCTAAHAEENA